MGWLKRNLFFAIGGLVALGLLGAAGFYDFRSWQNNTQAFAHLNELYVKLKNNTITDRAGQKISPGNAQVDNIAAAQEQTRQLRQWIRQTTNYFQPIAPIPRPVNGQITDSQFGVALHRTFDQLRDEASAANVALPQDFYFSFTVDQDRLTFAPGSLVPLSQQLGEVKAITEVLYAAGINALDGIQRLPVSADDANGPQTDYLTDQPLTTDLGVLTPYQITFRSFSSEIAKVFEQFADSSHGFIVSTISVQPAAASTTAGGYPYQGGYPAAYPGQGGYPAAYPGQGGYPAAYPGQGGYPPATPVPGAPLPGAGGVQPVLQERLLSVTMKVELVKLTLRN